MNFIGEGNREQERDERERERDVFTESTMNAPHLIMRSYTISKEDPKNRK